MKVEQIAVLVLTFVLAFGAALAAMLLLQPDASRKRIQEASRATAGEDDTPSVLQDEWLQRLAQASKPLAKLAVPKEGWDGSVLRTRFMNAGWRSPAAIPVYFAAKTALALAFPLAVFLATGGVVSEDNPRLLPIAMLAAAIAGFYLPDLVLRRRIRQRKQEIFEAFPDALDLITVCVEAGLALDAALLKVVEELRSQRGALGEELELLVLELRAGLSREKALRNLALRTDVDDVDMLVSMLVQADRFGTSIAESLRVQADTLRTRRRQRAEECAAKIAVKLLFPLIFFIFPSLMVVLLGSPALQFYRALMPFMMGQGG
ncbi:type II secretion system F family protein [Cupriavidus pauculus]|uniref:Type II secretion system F family protein n=1 Tax=Cupriavidus pauculus TaxID=82633 RepID=A0A5P2H085_9BURK|nr:type II secretion system F family protein [Cupriavidus pauculus]QET00840.1 type II secretion system F family protein [Cupriavidus pauculus]